MKLDHLVDQIGVLSNDGICVTYRVSETSNPHILWANAAFSDMFSVRPEDAIGMNPMDIHHWDYIDDFRACFDDAIVSGKNSFSIDTLCLRKDGSAFWGGVSIVILADPTGPGRHAITTVRDIDNLKNREQSAELALIENEHLLAQKEAAQSRLVTAIDMIPDPFCIYDRKDRIVIWNSSFATKAFDDPADLRQGMKKADIMKGMLDRRCFDDAVGNEDGFLNIIMADWDTGRDSTSMRRMHGRDYQVVQRTAGNGDRMVLQVDVSEHLRYQNELQSYAEKLEDANSEIREQALHDELTGLGNRRNLQVRLQERIVKRTMHGDEIAALHVDLDRFKQINDTMGHAAGDHVLRVVAEILKSKVRSDDTIARIGGDEFVILMSAAPDANEPELLADRLVAEIAKPIPFEGRLCRLGASIGIARTPDIAPEDLLACSDIALYKAKTGGRSTKATFDKADLVNLQASKKLGDDILRGLDNREFIAHFQPQLDAETGRIVAFEVLARWQHPEKGLLEPDDFLDAAAEFQVDDAIDRMVFQAAMAACETHLSGLEDPPDIALNVCLSRIVSPEVLVDIDTCTYPGRLCFELVETTFFDGKSDAILARLKVLRDLGVQLEVDDFGSGSASIVGLRHISPSRVKIDHRLVENIETSESARKLVQSIVDIGRTLNLGVTGEGVESAAKEALLRQVGCDRLQGYYLGVPAPLADHLGGFKRQSA